MPGIDEAAGQVTQAQAVQARGRQEDGVGLAGPELLQPGVDIAPEHADIEVEPQVQALGLPAKRGRAQAGALWQVFQPFGDEAEEGVPRILALGNGRQDQALGRGDGHVLERMDGAVDLAIEQGLLDLLGEEPLAADFQQAAVLDPVAGGGDDHQGGDAVRVLGGGAEGGDDPPLHLPRLGEGKLGATGPDPDRLLHTHDGRATSTGTHSGPALQEPRRGRNPDPRPHMPRPA